MAGDQVYFLDFRGDMDERLRRTRQRGRARCSSRPRDAGCRRVRAAVALAPELAASRARRPTPSSSAHISDARRPGAARRADPTGRQPPPEARRDPPPRRPRPRRRVRRRHRPRAQPRRRLTTTRGDPQVMEFPSTYGPRPAVARHPGRGPRPGRPRPRAHVPRALVRQQRPGRPEPAAAAVRPRLPRGRDDRPPAARAAAGRRRRRRGTHAVQVLRTYPARLRRYPFAPHGERSIAHAYRRAFAPRPAAGLPRGPVPVVAPTSPTVDRRGAARQPRAARRRGRAALPRPRRRGSRDAAGLLGRAGRGAAVRGRPAATGSRSTTWRTTRARRSTSTPRSSSSTTSGR